MQWVSRAGRAAPGRSEAALDLAEHGVRAGPALVEDDPGVAADEPDVEAAHVPFDAHARVVGVD